MFPQVTYANAVTEWLTTITDFGTDILLAPFSWLSIMILQIASLLTFLSGAILNYIVQETVVDMKENLDQIGAINIAWRAIRDVANMGFIFVLLYAAIQTILGVGKDVKGLIVRVVVVAILINFSLFFTQFVIDVSNVIAITFYDAISPGALTSTAPGIFGNTGIADQLMNPLKITSLWSPEGLNRVKGKQLLIIGIMGTIVTLITAFVLFAVALMFIIRFVVLIFVLILSPLAFVASILPQLEGQRKQWIDALIGQAVFAPIYFLLTWIVIVVAKGLPFGQSGVPLSATLVGTIGAAGEAVAPTNVGILVHFIVIIALLIASLTISKQWASKAGPVGGKLTSWATGFAGSKTLGLAGAMGRQSIGRVSQAMGESEALKKARAWSATRGGALGATTGALAKFTQTTGKKVGSSSFDVRGTGLGGSLDAGKPEKGGYEGWRKDMDKKQEDYTKSQAPSDKVKAKAKATYEAAKKRFGENSPQALAARAEVDRLEGVKKEDMQKRETAEIKNDRVIKEAKQVQEDLGKLEERDAVLQAEKRLTEEVKRKEAEIASSVMPKLETAKIKELETLKQQLEEATGRATSRREQAQNELRQAKEVSENRKEQIKAQYRDESGKIKPKEGLGDERKKKEADRVEKSSWAKFRGYNYTAAAKIRKGKSAKDEAADALKKLRDSGDIPAEEPAEAAPAQPAGPEETPTAT